MLQLLKQVLLVCACLFSLNNQVMADSLSDSEAVRLLVQQAEQGNVVAQSNLGHSYFEGIVVPKDLKIALYWIEKAALAGVPSAQTTLGWAYMSNDFGLDPNYNLAMEWNRKAASQGFGEGSANIGLLYEKGWGVPVNYVEAGNWYKKAIDQVAQSGQAELQLGGLYEKGLGSQKNIDEAKNLYRIVAQHGDDESVREAKIRLASIQNISLQAVSEWLETTQKKVDLASKLSRQGFELSLQGKYQEAMVPTQQSLVIRDEILGHEHPSTTTSVNNLAALHYSLSQYDQALPLFQRSLAIYEKIHGPDHENTAIGLNNLAMLYEAIGQYDKALPLLLRSLEITEKIHGLEHEDTATGLFNLAKLYKIIDQFDQALALYQRVLVIREKVLGPEHRDTAESINNLANLYLALGQYGKALPLYQRTIAIKEKSLGHEHPATALSINNLALLYDAMGQYDKALLLIQRALEIREKTLGPEHEETAVSIASLALQYENIGQYDKALTLHQRALAIHEKIFGPNHPSTAASLNNLAALHYELRQFDKALPLYQRALTIEEKNLGSEHSVVANTLNNLAALYSALGQKDQALLLYQRAFRVLQSGRNPEILKTVQMNLGEYYAGQNNTYTAIFYLKGAVNSIQSIRADSRTLDKITQKSLLQKNEDIYKMLAVLLVDAGRLAEAQQVLSMLKEDEYFDFIRRDAKSDSRSTRMNYIGAEKIFADRLDKLSNDSVALVDQLRVLNKQAKEGLTPAQEKQRTQIKAQLAEQEKQTNALLNDIPQQLRAAPKGQQLEVAQENLGQLHVTLNSLGHGAVLLQYLVTDTRVHIILTTPQMQLARKVEILAKDLNRKISAFRRVLQNPALDPRPLAQELYQLLIDPVADNLKKAHARTLMFSLDGSLRYLPMAALHDGKAYLVERYPLAMYTEIAKDKLMVKPDAHWKVAGLGITRKIGEFPPLPSVRQELDGIIYVGVRKITGGVMPGNIYLDKDFTQARLHKVLDRDYLVLHIASHFVFIPGTEAQSFLLLGDGKQLSLADLRTGGWKFDSVDMMTLSACETALGGGLDENGREIEGFGALVQRQGAKGVLATLWPVADQSTAILMQSLYRLRQEKGLTKASALRAAQLSLISGKHIQPEVFRKTPVTSIAGTGAANVPAYTPISARPFAHPYYWAPFILMGNWL